MRPSESQTACSVPGPAIPPATPGKIRADHLERLAVVYVRQSTPQQVLEHRESAALQYALADRARAWGWSAERILVIDEDQGQSGRTAADRPGFQRLLLEVTLEHVGLVLGLDMSRLARSGKDWHHLLETCAWWGSLLADQDGLYDPALPADRLLLGLKGTMSEAESYTLRRRMYDGRVNKARRGELFHDVPSGYVRLPEGGVALDPDSRVQQAIRALLDAFDALGTVRGVTRYLHRHDIRLGVRRRGGPQRGELEWRPACPQSVWNILHHPLYAGAYAWGRRPPPRCRRPAHPAGRARCLSEPQTWEVLLLDRYPAYLSWEHYLANLRRLQDNRAAAAARGAPREGPTLLGGLVRCGRCGRRMRVRYAGRRGRPTYVCRSDLATARRDCCQTVRADCVDELLRGLVLRVLEPAALELSLQAGADWQGEVRRLQEHWQQRLAQAGYEAELAARRYRAVDPDNRLVAANLERDWEERLRALRQAQEEYDRWQQQRPAPLGEAEQAQIRALAADLPGLWAAASTTWSERQAIVRHLVEEVRLQVGARQDVVEVEVRWAGGAVSRRAVRRPVASYRQLANYDTLIKRIVELREAGTAAPAIAARLNAEGFRPPGRGPSFTACRVRQLLCRLGRPCGRSRPRPALPLGPDEWGLQGLARELRITGPTLHRWLRRGWVVGQQGPGACGRWVLWADATELARLRRLRTHHRQQRGTPIPPELATPKTRPPG